MHSHLNMALPEIRFTPDFFTNYVVDKVNLDRLMDLMSTRPPGKSPEKELISLFPSVSRQVVNNGLLDTKTEFEQRRLKKSLTQLLTPWLNSSVQTDLPTLTAIELARTTGFSPAKIVQLIRNQEIILVQNGQSYRAVIDEQISLNPKKIIRESRYQSRPPGGGPVQRSRFQQKNVPGQIRRFSQERTKIVFDATSSQSIPSFKITEKEKISQSVMEVIKWFKQQRRKKWLRGGNEQDLTGILTEFSQGKPTDFVLWNCFQFDWEPNKNPNEKPSCIITNKLDTSLVLYFADRIKQTAEKLSCLAEPNFTVLIPSSEANYSDVWNYKQSPEERQQMANSAAVELNDALNKDLATQGIKIKAMRWDKYLLNRGITKIPDEYSVKGDSLIRQLPNFRRIQQEAIRNEVSYFQQRGITVSKKLVAENGIKYYGVYCGEGMGLLDIQKSGRNVVMINLEEFRVNEMTALGSNNQIPIVTPASHSEIMEYYGYQNSN